MSIHRPLARAGVAAAVLLALAAGLALAGSADPERGGGTHALDAKQGNPAAGREVFAASCASCHGADGRGTTIGPSLIGAGEAAVDFQLSTGRMPFAAGPGRQAKRKPPAFAPDQIADLVAYVSSLGPGGPPIPAVQTSDALLARGQEVYVANCAPCHGTTANGGAVGGSAIAPALDQATSVQVVEAIQTGPGQMPVFAPSEDDRNAVATYVDYLQRAPQPGGLSIGGIGPVPEGFVAWIVGMGLMLIVVYLVGREWRPGVETRP